MRRDRVDIGRKTISYLVVEPSTPAVRQRPARTVLFLHAFPLQAAMWESTLGSVPEGWRAIAPDFRGFGESSLPDAGNGSIAELAGDVVDLLDRLQIARTAVIGCSMGGYVLFELLRIAPNYVGAVGLVSTRAGADSDEGRKNREKMIETVEREGVEAVATQMVPKLLGASTQRDRPDTVKHIRNLIVTNGRGGVKAAVSAMRDRIDSTPLLGRIGVPAFVAHGREDVLIPPSEAEAMHRAIATARLEMMEDSGHLPNIEQPRAFAGALWQFLDAL